MRQVAALAVLACTAALSSGCGVIGGTGGQVVSYQGYGGTAIVSMDGRTITVGQFASGSCGTTVKAVARESATRVALLLRFSTPRNPLPARTSRQAKLLHSRSGCARPWEAGSWSMAGPAVRRRGSAPGSSCGPHVSRPDIAWPS